MSIKYKYRHKRLQVIIIDITNYEIFQVLVKCESFT